MWLWILRFQEVQKFFLGVLLLWKLLQIRMILLQNLNETLGFSYQIYMVEQRLLLLSIHREPREVKGLKNLLQDSIRMRGLLLSHLNRPKRKSL